MAAKPTSLPVHQPPDLPSLCLAITEHAPLPMATVEGATHIVRYGNPAFCRLMGQPMEQLVGKPFDELLPDKDQCVTLLERVFNTGKPESYTEQEPSKPHPVFWSYTIWPVLEDQGLVGVMIQVTETAESHGKTVAMNEALMLGSVRQHELTEAAENLNARLLAEIAERKEVEEALREAGERFRFLAESMPQKIFTAKPNGDIDYFNRQWMEFTGLTFEQIRDWGWTQFIHPDDLEETVRIWKQSIETGKFLQLEHRYRRQDGVYRWHLSRAHPMRDAEGKITMWIGSNTDIHEVKEADDRKNEFLAMLAHELRNPLAPIGYMLEVMKRADGNFDLIKPALGTIERQVRQMTRLIDDLLDVSRISRDKLQLRREEVDLASVINHVVEASRSACEAAQFELSVTLPPEPVYLHADPVRLEQVFGNLLNNACKFTKPAGRISLAAERQGGDVVITVRDSGVGIPSDMLPKIFEMFTQGDQTLERSQGGLGIGLTLVRRLVQMHGGSVQAFSDGADRGSEFIVRLPALIKKPESFSTDPTAGEPTATKARRILVVDDNHDAADALSILLTMTGNETHLAFDGEEAVEAAARFRPDVILLDIGMPKLNGYGAARHIREQPWGKGVVLVALTGWGQDEDRQKTADAGFDAHLVKPVDYAALTRLLASFPVVARYSGTGH